MAPRRPPIPPAGPAVRPAARPAARSAALLAAAAIVLGGGALLGGCAEMHRGVEAVGRIGGTPAPRALAAEGDVELPASRPASRTDVKTVRPRGAPRAPAADAASEPVAAPLAASIAAPVVTASAVPSPRQIFDFHPAGSRPDSWRQPFVIDTSDGPLAADVRRSSAELRSFLADQKAGAARRDAVVAAGADGAVTGTAGAAGMARRRCGETDVAQNKPGCAVPRPGTAAAAAQR